MPTAATHITVVERVAASSDEMTKLLGDPFADPSKPEGLKMRFAKLGSVGPDIFYALADYGGDLQTLENFLIKFAGSVEFIEEYMEDINNYVNGVASVITDGVYTSLEQTFGLLTGTALNALLAFIVGPLGVNLWPFFEPARQKDMPREKWYWADYLHYIKPGQFAHKLIENARATGNENLIAYAYGYLTHYVTDILGHPYVNQVVQGPWRLYWQRHHLVENYIDAYVWDRWHVPVPPPAPITIKEQALDTLTMTPNIMGAGADVTFSRLHDHINVGSLSIGDPVDELISIVANEIKNGMFNLGMAEKTDPVLPDSKDFDRWCKLFSATLKDVYDNDSGNRTPSNLAGNLIPGTPPRPDGYPAAEDIGAAYGVYRLLLRMSTEDRIQEPQPPDIEEDISEAIDKLLDDLQNNLNSFTPPPSINTSGSFSWDSLWDAIQDVAVWFADTLVAVGETVFNFIKNLIDAGLTIVSDVIKYALYLLNKALYAAYNAFRDVLVYAAYSMPHTNRLTTDIGWGHTADSLWKSAGNADKIYPVEEIEEERKMIFSKYAPIVPPSEQADSVNAQGNVYLEHPNINFTAPYSPQHYTLLTPDIFLEGGHGPDDMFHHSGLQQPVISRGAPPSISIAYKNFGGVIANCIRGIELAEHDFPAPSELPDYNLDGDRSYAWPCWDINNPEPQWPATAPAEPYTETPLRPEAMINDSSSHEALAEVTPVIA